MLIGKQTLGKFVTNRSVLKKLSKNILQKYFKILETNDPQKTFKRFENKNNTHRYIWEKKKKTMPGKNNIMVPNLHILKKDQNETET